MNKNFLKAGIAFAATAVILGAFGAHALKEKIGPDQLQVFDTGVRYQFYHALALLIVFLLSEKLNSPLLKYSGRLFIAGIFLFSGSVYLLSTRELLGADGLKNVIGPVTPLGGLCFISGWILLLIASMRPNA